MDFDETSSCMANEKGKQNIKMKLICKFLAWRHLSCLFLFFCSTLIDTSSFIYDGKSKDPTNDNVISDQQSVCGLVMPSSQRTFNSYCQQHGSTLLQSSNHSIKANRLRDIDQYFEEFTLFP